MPWDPLKWTVTALGWYLLVGGLISFLGWAFDQPRLTGWDGSGISIQPNATIATIATGSALLLLVARRHRVTAALGGLVALIGGGTIVQYGTGIDLGIDQLLMFERTWGRLGVIFPGRMGPPGAVCWTCIGMALVLASRRPPSRGRRWAPLLALVPGGISALSLIGYLYGASALYTIPTMTVIALQTATFVFAASVGLVLSVPEHGVMRVFADRGPAGLVTRSLLPVLVLVPIALGYLQTEGERLGLYDAAFGNAVRTIVSVSLFVIVLWATGRAIGRQAESRTFAEAERERLFRLERAARQEAERQATIKDDFLATLSHELRTPLNAVLGWVQILHKDLDQPAKARHALDVIERNGRLQAQLIADLLDMSRIVSGKMRLDVHRVALPAVIAAAIESVKPAADSKGVRIQQIIEPLAEHIHGDPARLQQIVWNLLSNAVKFTPRGGRIQVLLRRVNSHVELEISDTGEGIAADLLPSVFDRFRQGDASPARVHGGLGLGLAVAKQLVELHGGTISAASDGPGTGATFIVALPLAIVHSRSDEHRVHPRGAERSSASDTRADLRGARILIVDDEQDARAMLQRILQDANAVVHASHDAEDALSAIQQRELDIIVSDIGMPRCDGYEFMKECRSRGVVIPAIALTAFARTEDRTRALRSGYQSHIAKPVDSAELIATIAALIGRRPH